MLTRKPAEYPLYEILSTAEGGLAPVHCLSMDENECPLHDTCLTVPVWVGLHNAIKNYLSGISLAELKNQGVTCL